jgi:type III secretion system YscD/HrpQ family protein
MASEHTNGRAHAAAPREFHVLAGTHRGAVFTLAEDGLLVIGADESCDVRLSDAGIEPRHAALMSCGPRVSIRRLDGSVSVGAVALSQLDVLSAGDEVALGESGVRLRLADALPAPLAGAQARAPTRARRVWARPMTLAALAATLTMAVIAGVGLATQQFDAARPEPLGRTDAVSVRAELEKAQLDRRIAVKQTAHGVELSGVIERDTAAKLRARIAQLGVPVVDSILSEDELLEQVREVFRSQGLRAELRYGGERRVIVDNLDEGNERVGRAAAHVRDDVPQLAGLEFTAPDDARPPAHAPAYRDAAGQTLAAHVDGETAYLAAAGGARYFAGSTLPGGHVVRRITPQAVQVERDGEISWFAF